jgi:hypothetical protein
MEEVVVVVTEEEEEMVAAESPLVFHGAEKRANLIFLVT